MKKGDIIQNIRVEKLVFGGSGFARLPDGKVLFITGGAVPESVVNVRITKKKKDFLEGQVTETLKKSPLETGNHLLFPGAPWINIAYDKQLEIKENQLKEAFFHLRKYQENINFLSVAHTEHTFGYRNKIEFSFGKYISHKEGKNDQFNVGFHKKGEFSRVEDYNSCSLVDDISNTIYKEIKDYCKSTGLEAYDQKMHTGFFRHLLMRRTYFTDEMMIILSFNPNYFETLTPTLSQKEREKDFSMDTITPPSSPSQGRDFLDQPSLEGEGVNISSSLKSARPQLPFSVDLLRRMNDWGGDGEGLEENLNKIKDFFMQLSEKYSLIKSIYFSHNTSLADTAIGELELIYGKETITENLLGLSFEIGPKSFFQTNSLGAELLYSLVLEKAKQTNLKDQIVLDLFGGTGTIGMIFASHCKKVISVEMVAEASQNGAKNALSNNLKNISFVNEKVEVFLKKYLLDGEKADLLIIDPPRAGMHPDTLPSLLEFQTNQIIYVSCNPATLVRDLEYILKNSDYKIESVQGVDMFPHTHHIETIVSLVRGENLKTYILNRSAHIELKKERRHK